MEVDDAGVTLGELGDFHSGAVGDLLLQGVEDLFTDDLCADLLFGLVSDHISGEELGAFGQVAGQQLHQFLNAVLPLGGDGHDGIEVVDLAVGINDRQQLGLFHGVDLVDDQDRGDLHALDLLDEFLLGAAHIGDGLHQQEDAVHVGHALLDHVHHVVAQAVGCLVEAGGIHEDELAVPTGEDGADAVAGGLGLVADDGDLLTHQGVGQGGLAHVGTAADGQDAAALDLLFLLTKEGGLQGLVQVLVPAVPGDTQALQDGLFPGSHLSLLGAFIQVVIAQQVEDGVDGQVGHLTLDAVAELLGLLLGPVHGDDHVAQGAQAGLQVQLLLVLPGGGHAGGQLQHGEGQHVGGAVDVPVFQVDFPDALVVGEEDVHGAADVHLFCLQGGGDDTGQQGLVGIGTRQLPIDVNIMSHAVLAFCGLCSLPPCLSLWERWIRPQDEDGEG